MYGFVYKHDGRDSTNGGISSQKGMLEIGVDIKLVEGAFPGLVIAIPMDDPEHIGWMFGGNYLASSDSRFRAMAEDIAGHRFYGAIPIHDRQETQEQYDAMWN